MADKNATIATREQQDVARHDPLWADPFRMLDRLANEMDSVFNQFGLGRSSFGTRGRGANAAAAGMWAPAIEVHQQNNELVVRADLPGMKKEDIHIDVTDQDITISGERRQQQESQKEGVYRTERSYGSFCRTIALPEGAITDQANATFKDGVLEIKMPAPPEQVTKGRRLEIKDGSETRK